VEHRVASDAGIGDHDVARPQVRLHSLEGFADLVAAGDVDPVGFGSVRSQAGLRFEEGSLEHVPQGDPRSLASEALRHGKTYAARRAGDDGDLVFESHAGPPSFARTLSLD
jgi:hypothetical protein